MIEMKNKFMKDQKVMVSAAYDFTHEQWFSELSSLEYTLFAEYVELFQTNPQAFLELLASRKDQKALFERLSKITKAKKAASPEKREVVEQFFQQVPIMHILSDVMQMPYEFDYIVEKNVAEYAIGIKDGETFTAFSEGMLQDGKLYIVGGEEEKAFTVQALIYFIFANELLHQSDKERVIRCKVPYADAVYALSYAQALQEDDLTRMLISPAGPIISSAFFSAIVFSKALCFLSDVMYLEEYAENGDYTNYITEQCLIIAPRQQFVLGQCNVSYFKSKVSKLESREKQSLKKQQDLQNKLDRQQQKLDLQMGKTQQLMDELDARGKLMADTSTVEQQYNMQLKEIEQQFNDQMAEIKQQLKVAKENLKDEKKAHTKEIQTLDGKLADQTQENHRLINDVSALQKQLTTEKRQKLQMEELQFSDWLQKGREFLQQLTVEEEDELKGFIDLAQNIMHEQSLARPKEDLATNRIGYCRIEENGHFVNFGNDIWYELTSIPSSVYLSDNQFVEVTKDLELANVLDYFFISGPVDYAMTQFVVVEERHGQAFAKVNGKTKEIKYRENAFIRSGQVISINQMGELVTYYKNRSIILDDWLASIQLKGHTPLFVTMALSNGYVVRDLDGQERFIQFDEQLNEHSFIITDAEERIMYKDASGRMLKLSSKYKDKQLASVSEIDGQIYVLKENQEYVQLQNVPLSDELDLGDMIWIDEFNRFIVVVEEEKEFVPTDTIEKKLLDGGRKVTRKVSKERVEKTKDLLVIGNVRISERYKSYFGELGFEVEVVDGTGPFEKIRQACSKHTNILYSTAFTSHKNSGKMKSEVTKHYILCDSTAPKVMHYALENIS